MPRAGWSSWRACLLWGIATLIVSQSFALFMPATLAHPIPGSSIANPVLAFEFARAPAHLDAVFGLAGDPLRPERITGMMRGNVLDYVFMLVYGSFVLAFFGATARATGSPRWWLAGWLGPLAAASDAIENALLLSINADMATPEPELAVLAYPVWIKFTALAIACGFAAWALFRQRAWLPALLCLPPAFAIWFGLTAPYRWGERAVGTIAIAWVAMLAWAAWRALREGNAAIGRASS
jgi:hypothetical protein